MEFEIINTYHVGYADIDQIGASFMVVLVRKNYGGFKVYSGLVKLPDPIKANYKHARAEAAKRIAARGTPEQFNRARTFFPALKEDQYS